jgi:hypothetical protein
MSEIAQKPMSSIAKGSVLMVGKPVFAQATELSTKEILNEVRKLGNQKDFLSFDHVSMHVTAWDMLQNFIVDYIENTLEAEVPAFLKNRSVEDNFVRLTFDEVVWINEFLDDFGIETEVETGLVVKKYVAYVSQGGTDAPYPDDINGTGENSAIKDDINGEWIYENVGTYIYRTDGLFSDLSKVFVSIGSNNLHNTSKPFIRVSTEILNENDLRIYVFTQSSFTSPVMNTAIDNELYALPIEITVYP